MILKTQGKNVDLCIYIKVSIKELIKRISGRRISKVDGYISNLDSNQFQEEKESGNLYIREDDKPEIVKKRIEDNKKKIQDLICYYKNKDILEQIISTDKSIDDSYKEIKSFVVKYKDNL